LAAAVRGVGAESASGLEADRGVAVSDLIFDVKESSAGARGDLIRLEAITKVYGSGDAAVVALNDFSLTVAAGELLAVMGPSGSGKSTLMNILGCLDSPSSGRYWFAGDDVSRLNETQLAHVRNRRIGFVFQQFQLLPKLSAWRNVELPLLYRNAENRRELALHALEQVGLGNRIDHRPTQLSGGQQQRVAIARALVTDPDLILADEPTGNLDTASSRDVLAVLRELNEQGRTIIVITHDPEVAPVARRAVVLRDGRLVQEVAA
jgi:putative ABC transport system ATP-binding protein